MSGKDGQTGLEFKVNLSGKATRPEPGRASPWNTRCRRMQGSEMWEEYNVNYILYSKQKTKKRVQGV